MTTSTEHIPVVLLAYARPDHLRRVLGCLRSERVPLIYAFADGARGESDAAGVADVRRQLREIDWCQLRLKEREKNMGLGTNVLSAVSEVARTHDMFVVWEDDLICMPGTYAWICAALRHYRNVPRVMSVTGWTHPAITPSDVVNAPYLDGRAECWVWGAYARSWRGMERTARQKMATVVAAGRGAAEYGADLPQMVRAEKRRNIWAVRWLYHHLEHRGLCVRPPWSMVEHIGFDELATNSAAAHRWANPPLRPSPSLPASWPPAEENPLCRSLWQRANPPTNIVQRVKTKVRTIGRRGLRMARAIARDTLPKTLRTWLRKRSSWQWFRGDFDTWAAARAASSGYEHGDILDRVLAATLKVKAGQAAFERDSVLFYEPEPDQPLLDAIQEVRRTGRSALRVVDFGGSLGSTYWRLRAHLAPDAINAWDVVEQERFVAAGNRHVSGPPLRFFQTVHEAEAQLAHDILLSSTTLQYLESPAGILEAWRKLNIPYLLLNNLPLHATGATRLRVQHVPASIYKANYPVWFFNRAEFLGWILPSYEIVREFASEAVWPVDGGMYPSTGLLLKRISAHP